MYKCDIFVPGRLLLFGDHADWPALYQESNPGIANGHSIIACLPYGISSCASKSEVMYISSFFNGKKYIFYDGTATEADYDFLKYAILGAHYMKQKFHTGNIGLEILESDLPVQQGFASSAAICITIVEAFNKLYNLSLLDEAKMLCAFEIERAAGSQCGRTDQFVLLGEGVRHLEFFGSSANQTIIKTDILNNILVAVLPKKKNVSKIMQQLQLSYPLPHNTIEENVHRGLGIENEKVVINAIDAMENGNLEQLGECFNKAQQIFDYFVAPALPCLLSSPLCHKLLGDKCIVKYVYGGKINSQGDSSVLFLCKSSQSMLELKKYIEKMYHYHCIMFTG